MFSEGNILFPTDFSVYAHYAMRYAMALAKKYGSVVHIAHTLDSTLFTTGAAFGLSSPRTDMDALLASMRDHAESRLEHLVRQFEDEGIEAHNHITIGRPPSEIVALPKALDCGLIVIATHGRAGMDHVVFGSVCERVVRQSPVPVLAIKHPEHEFVEGGSDHVVLKRILFPTDFSDFSAKVLPYAASLSREFDATLVLFHAAEPTLPLPELMPDNTIAEVNVEVVEHARESMKHMGEELDSVKTEVVARIGLPHRNISELVQERNIDLVVMPTHGRSGIAHLLFGSVAEKVVRLARCPVLTIRPGGDIGPGN